MPSVDYEFEHLVEVLDLPSPKVGDIFLGYARLDDTGVQVVAERNHVIHDSLFLILNDGGRLGQPAVIDRLLDVRLQGPIELLQRQDEQKRLQLVGCHSHGRAGAALTL